MRAIGWLLSAALVACGSSDASNGSPLDSGGDTYVVLDSGTHDGAGDTTSCGAGTIACDGRCVVAASCAFAVTSIDPAGGWLNGGDWITLHGAGFGKGMHVSLGDGRAPVKVIDATSARVQTPPGPVGPADVTITLGAQTAKLPLAFVYHANGLSTPWAQKPMKQVRGEWPGVAVLQDARVLVAGGASTPDDATTSLDTADLYTRSSDTVTPTTGKMSTARWRAAAVTLLDGRVLVVGGACATCTGADLFDPTTNSFSPTKSGLNVARVDPRAVLMTDGRVFITSTNDGSIDVYDPDADAFTKIDHTQIYDEGFVVRLKDGRVLFGGGGNGTTLTQVETFDADTSTLATVGALPTHHFWPTAHVVPDGRVLVVGGNTNGTGAWTPMAQIEIFDPKTNAWTTASYALTSPRYGHGSTLVRDGTIIVVGGYTVAGDCNSLVDTVDQIDPLKGTVTAFAKLPNKNTELSVVTLADGSVLAVGGGACGASTALPDIDFLPGAPGPG